MPIYEYECVGCGKRFDILQKFSDEPIAECPDCSGSVKKLISNSTFVLKGHGWYADGYASCGSGESGNGKKNKTESKEVKASAESKPASSNKTSSSTSA